jgi:hypothetical protein
MGKDHRWMAVRQVVEEALADDDVQNRLPTTEDEWGFLADTITDHIVARFKTEART